MSRGYHPFLLNHECFYFFFSDRSEPKSLEELGEEAFKECNEKYSKVLRSLGKSLQEFLNGVGNFVELLKAKDNCYFSKLPFLHCKTADNQSELELHCYDRRMRDEWDGFVKGVVKSAAKTLFDVSVSVELAKDCREDTDLETEIYHTAFKIVKSPERQCKTSLKTLQHEEKNHSVSPVDLKISVPMLCSAFPFLLIFDEVLQIQQLGSALTRLIGPLLSGQDTSFDKFFQILEPKVRLTFTSILSRKNGLFVLRLKTGKEETVGLMSESGEIELRGQMIDLPESSCMLFLGSPRVESLEQLQGRGLYLSDIPLYDATRGLILVSEQALAQDGLKKKMEQLKTELQDASQELAREKRKTEDLLESIFPRDVAKKLIHRKAVPAKFVNDVSILFSDIVGFTSICGKCAPMEVVEMLNDLYTEFDRICGQLDLFKVIISVGGQPDRRVFHFVRYFQGVMKSAVFVLSIVSTVIFT